MLKRNIKLSVKLEIGKKALVDICFAITVTTQRQFSLVVVTFVPLHEIDKVQGDSTR